MFILTLPPVDLHRTFPENSKFKSTTDNADGSVTMSTEDIPAIISLRRVLYAFSVYCPHIGYCQSLNYIAGMLLLFMDEERAFWMLVTIIQDILPDGIYDITMEGANIDQTVLMMFIWERLPHIWNKISSGKGFWECEKDVDGATMPTITLVTSHWFLTLFINILPTEVSEQPFFFGLFGDTSWLNTFSLPHCTPLHSTPLYI
jgi:hypothetical protein